MAVAAAADSTGACKGVSGVRVAHSAVSADHRAAQQLRPAASQALRCMLISAARDRRRREARAAPTRLRAG